MHNDDTDARSEHMNKYCHAPAARFNDTGSGITYHLSEPNRLSESLVSNFLSSDENILFNGTNSSAKSQPATSQNCTQKYAKNSLRVMSIRRRISSGTTT